MLDCMAEGLNEELERQREYHILMQEQVNQDVYVLLSLQ